jgi:hypothetical protein
MGNSAMLMLCSSAGGSHSDFCARGRRCRHISSAAFMSCSECANSKIKGRMDLAHSDLSQGTRVGSEPGPR